VSVLRAAQATCDPATTGRGLVLARLATHPEARAALHAVVEHDARLASTIRARVAELEGPHDACLPVAIRARGAELEET
jgi:hypothetical protein